MGEKIVSTKKELLAGIEKNWVKLIRTLDHLSETQITTIQDPQGWTIKDHLNHLMRWEHSVVFFLQGKPRHSGLGVEETLYLKGPEDRINEAIYQQTSALTLSDTFVQFRETHRQLLELLKTFTDEDLQKRYRAYLPDEPGEGDGPPAINVVYGNTAHHYIEHLEWIEELTRTPGDHAASVPLRT